MSKEKQIDEMAKLICNFPQCINYNTIGECKPTECQIADNAEKLYNAGYRKQNEGEWKDQYNGKYANPIYVCSICGRGTLLTPHINELNNMEMVQALSSYCPNCGAKMKGGAK